MRLYLFILLIIFINFSQTQAQTTFTACNGVVAPIITNGLHPTVINNNTASPILTQQAIGFTNTEYLVIKNGTCARDISGNCDTTGDYLNLQTKSSYVIIGADTDGIFNPGQISNYGISLNSGDTFSVIPFSYNLNQVRSLANQILTGSILGTSPPSPCCAIFNLQASTIGFCDSLRNTGISSANDINNLEDFLNFLDVFRRGQLSVKSLIFTLQTWNSNSISSLLNSAGCGNLTDNVLFCYGISPANSYSYVLGGCNINLSGNSTASTSCGNNGSAQVVLSNPGIYSYLWSNGANSQTINNVNQGVYTVTITNNNNSCIHYYSVTVDEVVGYSISVSSTNCNRITSLTIYSNPNLYNYIWSNGATGSSVYNLPPGLNTVTATNSNTGCLIIGSINLPQVNNVLLQATDEFSCANNGTASIILQNPSSYTYIWSNGANGATAYNLSAGTYYVTATNLSNGCQVYGSSTINSFPGNSYSEIWFPLIV
jgi:hypothetical protein